MLKCALWFIAGTFAGVMTMALINVVTGDEL